jgi:RNA-binding protein
MIAAGPLLHCAPMILSESQKKYLRGLGHGLKPVVMIGDAGLTDAVRSEFDSSIEHHELIKVRVKVGDRAARDRIITSLCETGNAELVQRIGNMALLYRENPEKKRIELPR